LRDGSGNNVIQTEIRSTCRESRAQELSLDVGCGFLPSSHKKHGTIGIDLHSRLCDAIADAQNLPFRESIFCKIYLHSILEHLDHPISCLKESLRVAQNNALFEIIIPCDSRYSSIFLGLIYGFPFTIPYVLLLLIRFGKYGKLTGFLHSNCIQPHHIIPYFTKAIVRKKRPILPLCNVIRHIPILSKVLFHNRIIYSNAQGLHEWVISAYK